MAARQVRLSCREFCKPLADSPRGREKGTSEVVGIALLARCVRFIFGQGFRLAPRRNEMRQLVNTRLPEALCRMASVEQYAGADSVVMGE